MFWRIKKVRPDIPGDTRDPIPWQQDPIPWYRYQIPWGGKLPFFRILLVHTKTKNMMFSCSRSLTNCNYTFFIIKKQMLSEVSQMFLNFPRLTWKSFLKMLFWDLDFEIYMVVNSISFEIWTVHSKIKQLYFLNPHTKM